jgi:hypothetical protein
VPARALGFEALAHILGQGRERGLEALLQGLEARAEPGERAVREPLHVVFAAQGGQGAVPLRETSAGLQTPLGEDGAVLFGLLGGVLPLRVDLFGLGQPKGSSSCGFKTVRA